MTTAEQIRQERIERHQRGDHEWQPGPYIKVYDEPGDLILVCRCGAMTRRTIPATASKAATPAELARPMPHERCGRSDAAAETAAPPPATTPVAKGAGSIAAGAS